MFNNWDSTKTYKTIDGLMKAVNAFGDYQERFLIVQVPTGKNAGRYTLIVPYENGGNTHWMHRGFKVMG